jgi:hypothetical protein
MHLMTATLSGTTLSVRIRPPRADAEAPQISRHMRVNGRGGSHVLFTAGYTLLFQGLCAGLIFLSHRKSSVEMAHP